MKKWVITILIIAALGFLFYKWFFNQPCEPPEKPETVPVSAVWKGDCDGGVWIDLVGIKESQYRFRIYQDWNGELLMDSNFAMEQDKYKFLNKENWHELVCCYTHSLGPEVELIVVFAQKDKKMTYRLISIYPAYGGSDWQIIMEKYNL